MLVWLAASRQVAFAPISRDERVHSPVVRTFQKMRDGGKACWESSPSSAPHWCQSRDPASSLFKLWEESPSCHAGPHHHLTLIFSSLLQSKHNQTLDHQRPSGREATQSNQAATGNLGGNWCTHQISSLVLELLGCVFKMCQNHTFAETRERNILCIFVYQALLPILSYHSVSNNIEVSLTKQSGRLTRVWALLYLSNIENDKSEVTLYSAVSFTPWFLPLSLQKSAQPSYPRSIIVLPFYIWGNWGSEKLSNTAWSG